MSKEKLAIIIPTKERSARLERLLESMRGGETLPSQIVIVDGGRVPSKDLPDRFSDLPISYVHSTPPSLTVQRNSGLKHLKNDITLVGFFDDDVIPAKDAVKNMIRFWESASPDTGGAGFNVTNFPYEKPSTLEKIFLVNADNSGRILRSGFQSKFYVHEKTEAVDWIVGCGMVWRKSIFEEFRFDEWFSGYARYEEIDFSYRVGRKYKMFIVEDARIEHLNSLENIDFSFTLGKMQIMNRLYFVKKNKGLSVPLCYWACLGLFVNNLLKGLSSSDRKRYLRRSGGNIAGFLRHFSSSLRVPRSGAKQSR